ncbi:hypothetical protein KR032_000235, partial [Drosophila birchii]
QNQVKIRPEMFAFLRQMRVPNLSAIILRWMFHLARYIGILCFKFKTTTDNQVAVQENCAWWKWSLAILRVGVLLLISFNYSVFIITVNDLLRKFLHILRMSLNIACCLCLLRLHLFQGTDCTNLVNRFLQVFQKVQRIFKSSRKGFGGKYEFVLFILTISGIIYELSFGIKLYLLKLCGITDIYIALSNKLLMLIGLAGYMALGLLYTDLNEYVSTELRSQLESLEEQPTRQRLRKARRSLDKCLTLYQEVQSLTSMFQRIYNLPLLINLGQNCIKIALISYGTFIKLNISLQWLLTSISIEILNILLLTLSVQRTKLQFRTIRRLVLENCLLSENQEWHKTLEVFFTHLNLYEFRVRPLGLFDISNELLVDFISALITFLTVIIQYGMQLEAL